MYRRIFTVIDDRGVNRFVGMVMLIVGITPVLLGIILLDFDMKQN